ncbi:N-acetyltransferase family protein [Bacteroides sp. 214]|uniref:GNAT family N-acetyltransferase n=1 Tax=Bacteroides sp. 214 TaxID=2302935 RepID=UPI0013CF46B6|nr:GNAT family N-acetyltransferase [Bacteroides sp. 214]NDW11846.1 N-acetyltransferase family protein [Bacteroides sp. 214]
MSVYLKELQEEDLLFVKEIYDYYILHTTVVYFTEPISIETLKSFIPIGISQYPSYLIIEEESNIPVGFCYCARFKPREAYDITTEATIYFKPEHTGKGYGYKAMELLEIIIREKGIKNILAVIDGANKASLRFFENCGFEQCGCIKQVAQKFGKELDVVFYQKTLRNTQQFYFKNER